MMCFPLRDDDEDEKGKLLFVVKFRPSPSVVQLIAIKMC